MVGAFTEKLGNEIFTLVGHLQGETTVSSDYKRFSLYYFIAW